MKVQSAILAGAVLQFFGLAMVISTPALASVSNDQVTSQKIREADGTSGQNTNSGSGVKTDHIQDGAVTASKIADGAVNTSKIIDGAVTAVKLGIVCPDGQFLVYTAGGGWNCGAGTPGPEGPQGPVGPQGPTGAEGAVGPDGPQPHYANVAIVAKSGGDYADPVAALQNLSSWCGTPSAENPCLIRIMPGVYDLSALWTQSYVDIEGSGRSMTSLQVENVIMASHSELRSLTIRSSLPGYGTGGGTVWVQGDAIRIKDVVVSNTGTGSINTAIYSYASSATMENVTAEASGASQENIAINFEEGSTFTMSGVTATAIGGGSASRGIKCGDGSTVVLTNSTINASGALLNHGLFIWGTAVSMTLSNVLINADVVMNSNADGILTIRNSVLNASLFASDGMQVGIAHSQVTGALSPGTYRCIGAYDAAYSAISCP